MRILFLLAAFLFLGCNLKSKIVEINYYKSGSKIEINQDSIDGNAIDTSLKSLISGTTEILRLYIDEERFAEIKKSSDAVEIIFDSVYQFNSNGIGGIPLKKILIPLTGDYGINNETGGVIILTGEDEYSSTPILNPEGAPIIKNLLAELNITGY